jgi:pyruvate dehydrogenase E1 component alpha subunit
MELNELIKKKIFEKASLCRAFENEVFRQVKLGNIKLPVYLSAGQEYIPATLSVALEAMNLLSRQIFIQHRGHSSYICFGGDLDLLVLELLGDESGCTNGMGGSASIHSKQANIYGHDGLMGTQGPIATGMCYANKMPTLCFTGDAAAEEDYFLTSIGWASTKKLPIWYIVEDNNFSILTEKKIRRNWEMHDVALGMKVQAHCIEDDPGKIFAILPTDFKAPLLLNIKTHRKYWHAGAGIDLPEPFDRHQEYKKQFDNSYVDDIENKAVEKVRKIWESKV